MCEKATRIAEIWNRKLQELEADRTAIISSAVDTLSPGEVAGIALIDQRLAHVRAELARLCNEQPKGAVVCLHCHGAGHEQDTGYYCKSCNGSGLISPAPSPKPVVRDVRQRVEEASSEFAPTLTQGEGSEPVGWQYEALAKAVQQMEAEKISAESNGSSKGSYIRGFYDLYPALMRHPNEDRIAHAQRIKEFIYASPPALPAANADPRVREALEQACKPWEFGTGDPPEYESPLTGVFCAGMAYTESLLAKLLHVTQYEGGDGSEDFDQDATKTLENILTAAKLYNPEDDSWAALPSPPSQGLVEAAEWRANKDYDNEATWPPRGHPLYPLFHNARLKFPENMDSRNQYERIVDWLYASSPTLPAGWQTRAADWL